MAVFRSSVISYFAGMLLRYFVNGFAMVPVAPITVCHFTFQIGCIYLVKSSYFKIFSAASLTTRQAPEIIIIMIIIIINN
jgi:hypothetical protein